MTRVNPPSAGYLVWHLSIRWRVAMDRALRPLGLTHAHYALLASLYGLSRNGARPSQRELAEFSGLEQMYVSKLSRVLERQGLLARSDHPRDPRAFRLALTKRGTAVVTKAVGIVQHLQEQFLEPLGGPAGPRCAVLMDMLETLVGHARALERGGVVRHEREVPPRARKQKEAR
jgi:MarR family transcriptional regulator, organic hydroperoxide resistance regulator